MKLKKYEIVAQRIEKLVESGVLTSGEKLPSVRAMASQSGFSMMTVLEGYRLLEDKGFIESRPQSGYYLRPPYLRSGKAMQKPPRANIVKFPLTNRRVAVSQRASFLARNASRVDTIPLGSGYAAPDFFPSRELSIRVAKTIRNNPLESNRYLLDGGDVSLRKELARWMIESGCEVDPQEIIVTSGASQALLFALKALCKPGDSVAVESPGYYGFYNLLEYLDLNAVEIPCDPLEGISLEDVEEASWNKNIKCLLTSANLSNPTGATIPEESKRKLVNICSAKRIPIIEDDTYGDLVFEGRRRRSLKSYSEENVIYIGSLSKTVAPGYRIGWLAPGNHFDNIMREYRINLFAANLPTQMGVAAFLREKGMRHQLQKVKNKLRENMSLFLNQIAEYFPAGTETSHPEGGHFLWVKLANGSSSEELATRALKEGISIAPGLLFSSQQHYQEFFRINTGIPWSDEIAAAVKFLGRAAADLTK